MTLRSIPFALGALALVACGGNVAISNTSTSGGTGGAGGGTTTGGGGDSGGSGGATGGSGGAGGSANCARTHDGFHYTLTPTGGKSLDCSSAEPGGSQKAHIEGVVTAAGPTDLTIDTCPPNADCNGGIYQLSIQSPGFAMSVAAGTFIQIDVQIDFPWGCSNIIMARNLPKWGGLSSPGGDVPWLIFEASEGANQVLEGSPFSLTTLALGCHPNAEPGCGLEDEYRFDIHGISNTSAYQGETTIFDANEGGQVRPLQFRNLRSFETGWCDDYWNWAYWVVPAPLLGE
jgi:hypothetical protein